jgi:hypothetical protein
MKGYYNRYNEYKTPMYLYLVPENKELFRPNKTMRPKEKKIPIFNGNIYSFVLNLNKSYEVA